MPRHVYDLDQLTQARIGPQGFEEARAYAQALYEKECAVHRIAPRAGEPWDGIDAIEARIPAIVRGRAQIRRYRTPITDASGVPHNRRAPRVHLWEGSAQATDLPAALTELSASLD